MQKIETPVGEVHVTMRVDHHGRETAEVELIPAEGCVIDFRSLKRELPVPPPDMPSKRELVRELKKARRWLSEPQPDGAAYPTHFGVGPKRAIGCLSFRVAPGHVWFSVPDSHPRARTTVRGKVLRPLNDDEKGLIRNAVKAAGFDVLEDWDGPLFHSFRVVNHAKSSNIAAYANYRAFERNVGLVVPDDWH